MLKRRVINILFHLAAALSLAVCVAVLVAWAKGGWTDNQFHALPGRWEYVTDGRTSDGQIQIVLVHDWLTPDIGPPAGTTGAPVDAWLNHYPNFWMRSGQFGLHYWTEIGGDSRTNWMIVGRRLDVDLPFWGAAVTCLILPTVVWIFLTLRRRGIRAIQPATQSSIDDAILAGDLSCIHCAYNLRTQNKTGQCPECGSPIEDTLTASASLAKARPAWLRCLAAGHAMLFLSRIFLAATYVFIFQRNGGFVREYVPALGCAIGMIACYAAGIFLVTAREFPMQHALGRKSEMRLRRLVAASLLLLAAGVGCQVVETLMAGQPFGLMGLPSVEWYWLPLILLLLGWILFCWCVVNEFGFHAKLAGADFGSISGEVAA